MGECDHAWRDTVSLTRQRGGLQAKYRPSDKFRTSPPCQIRGEINRSGPTSSGRGGAQRVDPQTAPRNLGSPKPSLDLSCIPGRPASPWGRQPAARRCVGVRALPTRPASWATSRDEPRTPADSSRPGRAGRRNGRGAAFWPLLCPGKINTGHNLAGMADEDVVFIYHFFVISRLRSPPAGWNVGSGRLLAGLLRGYGPQYSKFLSIE